MHCRDLEALDRAAQSRIERCLGVRSRLSLPARVSSRGEIRPQRMMTTLDRSPLGKPTDYPERYDPALLFPIARAGQREVLGLRGQLPFGGVDLWTAYEITWLDTHGKPQVAIGELRVPAD